MFKVVVFIVELIIALVVFALIIGIFCCPAGRIEITIETLYSLSFGLRELIIFSYLIMNIFIKVII